MSLSSNISDLATRIATEIKALRTLINGNAADLSALTTTAKGNLVLAVNEVKNIADTAAGGGVSIDDVTPSTTTTYSSSKIESDLAAEVSALVDTAPATLDTLNELAAALGDDPNFATTITDALGNRVRVDAAQAFSAPQQLQGRQNIDAAGATDVGDTTVNYVTTFEAGLV